MESYKARIYVKPNICITRKKELNISKIQSMQCAFECKLSCEKKLCNMNVYKYNKVMDLLINLILVINATM